MNEICFILLLKNFEALFIIRPLKGNYAINICNQADRGLKKLWVSTLMWKVV